MNDEKPTILLWIDTETTALDPADGDLLEIGMLATDLTADNELAGFFQVIGHDLTTMPIGTTTATRMHLDNGLLDEVSDPTLPDPDTVAKNLREFLWNLTSRNHVIPSGTNLQFDYEWINAKLPDSGLTLLSHRRNDLTTNRIQLKALGQDPYNPDRHATTHRVRSCIARDINEYKTTLTLLTHALETKETRQ